MSFFYFFLLFYKKAPKSTKKHQKVKIKFSWCTLYSAIKKGNVEVLQLLLEKGRLDVNWGHNNVLNIGSSKVNLKFTWMLIGNSAGVNCWTGSGLSPLHKASQKGHLNIACLLLDHSASVNTQMQYQWKPFHLLLQQGHLKVRQLPPEQGTDAHMWNDKHQTMAQLAMQVLSPQFLRATTGAMAFSGATADLSAFSFSSMLCSHVPMYRTSHDHSLLASLTSPSIKTLSHACQLPATPGEICYESLPTFISSGVSPPTCHNHASYTWTPHPQLRNTSQCLCHSL